MIILKNIIYIFQIIILNFSYLICFFLKQRKKKLLWIIGTNEVSATIYYFGKVLSPSKTISLSPHPFYNYKYDYYLTFEREIINRMVSIIYAPILLGYLTNIGTHFLYIWEKGFLIKRDYELYFLKEKEKKIVCVFCGSDIRAPKLMSERLKHMNIDGFIEYEGWKNKKYLSKEYDNEKKRIAKLADKYADLIFSYQVDQTSYLKSDTYIWPYMFEIFNYNSKKFDKIIHNKSKIKIVHAPSNPIIKGTPLVRAAIKKLELDGYFFEYVEIMNSKNEEVLNCLKNSHIVLNQFYAFVPGLFGIEGMANHCAVLMSADPDIETDLPNNSKDAWLITSYWQIYDNLKLLLDNPNLIKEYADRGYQFTKENYSIEAAKIYYKGIFKNKKII